MRVAAGSRCIKLPTSGPTIAVLVEWNRGHSQVRWRKESGTPGQWGHCLSPVQWCACAPVTLPPASSARRAALEGSEKVLLRSRRKVAQWSKGEAQGAMVGRRLANEVMSLTRSERRRKSLNWCMGTASGSRDSARLTQASRSGDPLTSASLSDWQGRRAARRTGHGKFSTHKGVFGECRYLCERLIGYITRG